MDFNKVVRNIRILVIGRLALPVVNRSTRYHLIHDAMKVGMSSGRSITVSVCRRNGNSVKTTLVRWKQKRGH